MLKCRLKGGLGNQMFQIFTTLSHSIKTGNKYNFTDQDVVDHGIRTTTYWITMFRSLLSLTSSNDETFEQIFEQSFSYNELPLQQNNMCLNGYFQSYKYFENNYNTIISLIELHKIKVNVIQSHVYNVEQLNTTISVHFRRGDYKNYPDKYPLLTSTYYERSISYILANKASISYVLYFCEESDLDDVGEMIEVLTAKFPSLTFRRCSNILDDWEQMLLMSACSHNIIANSTFSWWAAYLNDNSDKIVCYPYNWFTDSANLDTTDLFPFQWKEINGNDGLINQDFILLIMNCRQYLYKATIQKKTWLKTLPPPIKYFHVIGDTTISDDFEFNHSSRVLTVKTDDDYVSLPAKVMAAFRAVTNTYNFKFIYKTDDDQILVNTHFFNYLPKLITMKKSHYGGYIVDVKKTHVSKYYLIHPELPTSVQIFVTKYCSGRFYFLSHEAVDYLIQPTTKELIANHCLEDYAIGYHLHERFKSNILFLHTNDIFTDYIF